MHHRKFREKLLEMKLFKNSYSLYFESGINKVADQSHSEKKINFLANQGVLSYKKEILIGLIAKFNTMNTWLFSKFSV